MKLHPFKPVSSSDFIPNENEVPKPLPSTNPSFEKILQTMLSELGMGYLICATLTSSAKHIDLVCSRQLRCTRYKVPSGTDLYTYMDAENYPSLYYLVSGDVVLLSQTNIKLREFHGPHDYNLNHLLQPAAILLGRHLRNYAVLQTSSECEVIQFIFKVSHWIYSNV